MPGVTVLGACDPVLGWDGAAVYSTEDVRAGVRPPASLEGVAAAVQPAAGGTTRLFRDRLGLGKLFWARNEDGAPVFAARPEHLIRAGYALGDIVALPRGCNVTLDTDGYIVNEAVPARPAPMPPALSLEETGTLIRRTLDAYLAAVAATYAGRRAYLCLSGGLDSSTIAVLAQTHFSSLTAISFNLVGPDQRESEDRLAARKLTEDLGMPMLEVDVTAEELLSYLDLVLIAGIDWRDFNVHCGLVNAAIAAAISHAGNETPALVVTGDLSNELLVDYKAETYNGAVYYALPRLDLPKLRAALVDGLDTCHREVGNFGAFGLTVAQPYAACVDIYLSLSAGLLGLDDRKERLVNEIVGSRLPDYIYRRPKVRAQIGDAGGGGTLAACVDNGVDARWLRRRFAKLHHVEDEKTLDRFIRGGRYRAAMPGQERQRHAHW